MELSKVQRIDDPYEESVSKVINACLKPIESLFDGFLVESAWRNGALLIGGDVALPFVKGSRTKVQYTSLWHVALIILMMLGAVSVLLSIGQIASGDNEYPLLYVAATMFFCLCTHVHFRKRDLRENMSHRLHQEREALVHLGELLCKYASIYYDDIGLPKLQKIAVDLASGKEVDDQDVAFLVANLLCLYANHYRPEMKKAQFEAYYCKESNHG